MPVLFHLYKVCETKSIPDKLIHTVVSCQYHVRPAKGDLPGAHSWLRGVEGPGAGKAGLLPGGNLRERRGGEIMEKTFKEEQARGGEEGKGRAVPLIIPDDSYSTIVRKVPISFLWDH